MDNSVTFEFPGSAQAMALAGYREDTLKRLARQTGAKLVLRGSELLLSGTDNQIARSQRLIQALEPLWSKGQPVETADLMTAIHAVDTHQEADLTQL
ncbi:MAG: hypothetical protein AAF766_24170 [Cyanobacteria bacterium P01_D01_bin.14]